MSATTTIRVWTDVQCIWCYIGHAHLIAAVERFAGAVRIEYHTFELQPDAPIDFDAVDYLRSQRGMPDEERERSIANVARVASASGIDYRFDLIKPTNSVNAHQLLHYAKARGRQVEVLDRLFEEYFTNSAHLGRVDDLADLAADLGFDRADIVRSLSTGEYIDATRADSDQAAQYGVTAVPFYVINNRYGLSGAQSTDAFLDAITAASRELAPSA